jgi:serine/threonine protein kinase/tetratricopeptide (TPR) repeat protein
MDHLSSEQIASLLEDRLDEPVHLRVAAHLDSCKACQTALDDLVGEELYGWKPASGHFAAARAAGPVGPAYERAHQRAVEALNSFGGEDSVPIRLEEMLNPPRVAGDLGALGDYRIRAVIGHGGMGVVFEAVDPTLDRTVALKALRASPSDTRARQRFVREAQTAAKVKHDHVVTVFAVHNPTGAAPYLTMEFLPGPTFRDLIVARGRLAPRLAAELCAQVAEGVAAAHEAGLVHRDIKPNNVLLAPVANSGETGCAWRAKVADFGLARPIEHAGALTQDGTLCGTPVYISPEQIRDPATVDARSDVYSLGVTLYEALTGEVPFRGSTPMVLQQAISDDPRPPGRMAEGVPRDLETICLKAMAKEPGRRYESPRAFADDLRRWLRSEPILARPLSRPELIARWCRRNPRVAALSTLAAGLLLLVVIGSVVAVILIARAQRETTKALATAKDQRSLALDSLNDLISRVQNVLADRPGTIALREQILTKALANLERIARDADSGKIVDHDTIMAHQRIGDVLWMSGRNDAAREHFEKSRKLAESMQSAGSAGDQTQRDLAWAHDKLGMLDQHALKVENALTHYRQALELRESAARSSAQDVEAQRELVASLKRMGDAISLQGNATEARDYFKRARDLSRELSKAAPDDALIRRDLINALRKVSWSSVQAGDIPTAEQNLSEAAGLLESLRKRDPDNLTWKQEAAWIHQDLGTLLYQKRDYAGSVSALRQALVAQTAITQSDPAQSEFQWNLAQVENALCASFLAQGQYPEAREHVEAAANTLASLAEKHPSSTKYGNDACLALSELGTIEWRLNHLDNAQRQYERSLQILQNLDARRQLDSEGMKSYKKLLEQIVQAFPLRDRALQSLEFVEQQPVPTASVLLVLRAYALAHAGRRDEARQSADRAGEFVPKEPYIAGVYWLAVARVYGILAEAAAAPSSLSESPRMPDDDCIARAKAALQKAFEAVPSLRGAAVHEPELRSVR